MSPNLHLSLSHVKDYFSLHQRPSLFSGFKIEYIWASHLPRGHIFDHPGEKYCKVFVLESGEGKAGQWTYEERNFHKDYKKVFGTEPSRLLTIGIQTDTDHSNEMVTVYYSDPILKKK